MKVLGPPTVDSELSRTDTKHRRRLVSEKGAQLDCWVRVVLSGNKEIAILGDNHPKSELLVYTADGAVHDNGGTYLEVRLEHRSPSPAVGIKRRHGSRFIEWCCRPVTRAEWSPALDEPCRFLRLQQVENASVGSSYVSPDEVLHGRLAAGLI
jgi:hypothetical protein